MRPGRGVRAAMNAALAFILGLLFVAAAISATSFEASALLVWAFIALAVFCAIPLAYWQLFDQDD